MELFPESDSSSGPEILVSTLLSDERRLKVGQQLDQVEFLVPFASIVLKEPLAFEFGLEHPLASNVLSSDRALCIAFCFTHELALSCPEPTSPKDAKPLSDEDELILSGTDTPASADLDRERT
ncbi:unnamed protein product [Echinostoma caproni]|uniref:Uncharacterized protein n=1 Tax=Echinostoma caproni TaxID=27848 RepID=A0A183ADJ5_9TREM|nr:unnamed protein product [Echinostoma caproni]